MDLDDEDETFYHGFGDEEDYDEIFEVGIPPKVTRNHTIVDIHGVDINFPLPPYECQKALMEKLIVGLTSAEHCLLESPTGTGKTAVLLCSVLAWQRKFQNDKMFRSEVFEKTSETIESLKCDCEYEENVNNKSKSNANTSCELEASNVSLDMFPSFEEEWEGEEDEEKLDLTKLCRRCIFKYVIIPGRENFCEFPPKIFYTSRTHQQIKGVANEFKDSCYSSSKMTILSGRGETCINEEVKKNPKVVCGNSTDSKIEDVKPEKIAKNVNKNCSILKGNYYSNQRREPKGNKKTCKFFFPDSHDDDKSSDFKSQFHSNPQGFDIEEIVSYGKSCDSCPFFGSRYLLKEAEIVFCPYNYIINPWIRKVMKIDLRGSIVIFDEAHNIASSCEDAFSQDIKLSRIYFKILEPLQMFLRTVKVGNLNEVKDSDQRKSLIISPENYEFANKIAGLLDRIIIWMKTKGKSQKRKRDGSQSDEFEKFSHQFSNTEIIKDLNMIGFSLEETIKLQAEISAMKKSDPEIDKIEEMTIKPNQPITEDIWTRTANIKSPDNLIKRLIKFFKFFNSSIIYIHENLKDKSDSDYADYKVFIETLNIKVSNTQKSQENSHTSSQANSKPNSQAITQKIPQPNAQAESKKEKLILKIVCLNPALAFKSIRDQTHTTIVISGTLSPFDTFESELETKFSQKLAGNHVITAENLLIERIDRCLISNDFLSFTFLPRSQENTLRGVGEWLIKICEMVPKGVLVFFASYSYMEQVLNFLNTNNTTKNPMMSYHAKLVSLKELFVEARNKEEFKAQMKEYAAKIKSTQNGCLFFGVLRGKASEGTNFCDDMARAVLCIGIPYASKEDLVVDAKMNYITKKHSKIHADKWYDAQAFRAINQAIGRCIRHSQDWGMIMVMDVRFNSSNYSNQLPIWVKNKLEWRSRVPEKVKAIEEFVWRKVGIHEAQTQLI